MPECRTLALHTHPVSRSRSGVVERGVGLDYSISLLAAVTGWRYAFVALAAGPMTALPAVTTLNRRMRRDRHAIPITATERTSP